MYSLKNLVVLCLVYFSQAQTYLPKVLDHVPFDDKYAKDVCRSGTDSFWMCHKDGAATLISDYPVRPNAVTKVTFYL